jgi:hypothetical protein
MKPLMSSFRQSTLGLALLVGAIAVAPGCADDPAPDEATGGSSGSSSTKGGSGGDAGAGGAGTIACMDLGQICHDADDGADTMGAECHDIGHEGDGEACLEAYDECIEYCMSVLAGGAGGGGHGHEGGAGGEAHHGGAGGEAHHGGAGGEAQHGGAGGA